MTLLLNEEKQVNKLATQFGALVVLAAVLALFTLPAFNLQPTALRASRSAQQLFLVLATLTAFTILQLSAQVGRLHPNAIATVSSSPDLIDLLCIRLC